MAQPTGETKKAPDQDVFNQAAENFKAAMDAGVKFQQEAFKSMFAVFSGAENADETRKRMESLATDSIDLIRKNAEQSERLFDAGCRTGMDALRKTFETVKVGNGQPADLLEQSRSLWKTGLDAMRANVENAAKAGTQTIENWAGFFEKTVKATEKAGAR